MLLLLLKELIAVTMSHDHDELLQTHKRLPIFLVLFMGISNENQL